MKEKIIKYIKICLIVIALEVILFNITSYRVLFGKYQVKEFYADSNQLEFIDYQNGKARIRINDINIPVATIKIELREQPEEVFEYYYNYMDETTTNWYIGLPSKKYLPEEEKTHYIPLYLSGDVSSILLNIDSVIQENELIKKVVINEKIPFDFNLIRVLILILLTIVIDIFKNHPIMNESYNYKNLKQEIILLSILIVSVLLLIFINTYSASNEIEDMYNKGLVEAILSNQLYLLKEPSEEFKKLENPYDVSLRDNLGMERGEDYIWDSAYYDGKFYVYFGILPVLILFLPYYLITKKYLECSAACLLFSVIILILLQEILCKFFKRYFKDLQFKFVVYALMILYAGSMIYYMNGCSRFYEVAILSGVCFVLFGILFILKSMEKSEKKYRYMLIGCLFMALSVACRPTNVFCTILIVPYLWKEFIQRVRCWKENKKSLLQFLFSIAIPYLAVAIPLMWYNYVRFGNIVEFGARYQLTINNMESLQSRIFVVPINLLCNLFSVPRFIATFPFIENHNNLLAFYGFSYIENMIGGLFVLVPICFMCFFVHKISKRTEESELKNWIYSLIITGIIIAIFSAAIGGSIQRYIFDYAWIFILASIFITAIIFQSLKSEETKKIFMKILSFVTVYIVVINILSGIVSEKSYFEKYSKEMFYKIKYSICFWE